MSTPAKPYMIGISGGSASGKTFLLNRLLKHFSKAELTLISQDNYYRKREQLPRDAQGDINFDHPDALDLDTFARDIERLKRGESVTLEEYTFNNASARPRTLTYHPSPIILIEGLFVFYKPEISRQLDLRIFVDADEHVKLSRRIRRDFEERGYSLNEVLYYYEKYVVPMYKKYVDPFKEECDLIIPNNYHMEKAIQVLIDHLDLKSGRYRPA